MDLSGKNVAYVGGFGGIGYACCAALVTKGISSLVVLDISDDLEKRHALQRLNPRLKLKFVTVNLCNGADAIDAALKFTVSYLGHIDVLVNGAGILNDRRPRLTIDINLTGLIETTLAAIPLMSRAEGGSGGIIVNVASVLGLEPGAFVAVYTATKHAVVGFTRACAHEHYLQHTGIKHMVICPGATVTGILDQFVGLDTFEYSAPISAKIITAKNQTSEECAAAMVAAIEKAKNGSVWLIDLGELKEMEMHKYWEYRYD